jgi:hypothetical protein
MPQCSIIPAIEAIAVTVRQSCHTWIDPGHRTASLRHYPGDVGGAFIGSLLAGDCTMTQPHYPERPAVEFGFQEVDVPRNWLTTTVQNSM